jgi:hypothetical protein
MERDGGTVSPDETLDNGAMGGPRMLVAPPGCTMSSYDDFCTSTMYSLYRYHFNGVVRLGSSPLAHMHWHSVSGVEEIPLAIR